MNNSEQPVIAVIGLGLLGASLGMALRGGAYRRSGWTRRPNIRRWALDCDVLDETCDDIESVLNRADLTLIALPIPEILHYLKQYAHAWRPGTVVTDLGSVKSCVMEAAAEHLAPRGVHFVGSHPMAGTEKSGPESAFPELYGNADVFVCPFPDSPAFAVEPGRGVVAVDRHAHHPDRREAARRSGRTHQPCAAYRRIVAGAFGAGSAGCADPRRAVRRVCDRFSGHKAASHRATR